MSSLRRAGLDEATAHFVTALDPSIAVGDLETKTDDLAHLLGHPARPLPSSVRMAYDRLIFTPKALTLPSGTQPTATPAAGRTHHRRRKEHS